LVIVMYSVIFGLEVLLLITNVLHPIFLKVLICIDIKVFTRPFNRLSFSNFDKYSTIHIYKIIFPLW